MKSNLASVLPLAVALFALSASAQQPQPKPAESIASFQSRLSNYVAQARFAAAGLGVKVVSLDTGKVLFEHDANKLLKPASNAKLFTGALALDRLGPDFRIRTSCYAASRPDATGALAGDLVIFGRGDFSMAARFNNGDYSKSLEPLANAIVAAGIKSIAGDLVGDESFFHGPPLGDGWAWDDLQYYYGAEVSALTHEDNVVDLVFKPGAKIGEPAQLVTKPATTFLNFISRVGTVATNGARGVEIYRPIGENNVFVSGSIPFGDKGMIDAVAVHHPALWFITELRDALAKRGVTVAGKLRTVNWLEREAAPVDWSRYTEVAFTESRPLSELVAKMMKPSQNLYAHLLLLQVGARSAVTQHGTRNADSLGLAELNKFLAEAGVRHDEVHLQEGSGLSRTALVTPNSLVTLLMHMARHRHAQVFRDALPIAGVDGTLRARLKGTPAERNALAKTGTLGFVNTISGYVTSGAGERLVFSIMLNAYSNSDPKYSGKNEVDALVAMLAGFNGRSAE
ncbi:MAG: D-alanyl-D-alanine carboxypeptidase/D-alanyl-D-alanine-endopeptidase [Verrucomicrobia bacterium]|nr:D-alanyl-D-alanine carboxypeptidase/D-alanyl-D-alanine-endopeptidase [Verrucomicrobiota bacterium]